MVLSTFNLYRLYEFEPISSSSVVTVKNPVQEKLLQKVGLPFSLVLGKNQFDDSSGNIYKDLNIGLHSCLEY